MFICVFNNKNIINQKYLIGVGYFLRKVGVSVIPVVELTQDGEYYVLKQSTTIRNVELRFKPNEEFIEQTPGILFKICFSFMSVAYQLFFVHLDGRKTKTIITFETENVLIQRQFDGKPVTIVREFSEDDLIMVCFFCTLNVLFYF